MKIAINCIFCQPRGGGIKEYIVNLTNNIASIDNENEYVLYVLEDQLQFAKTLLPGKYRIKTVPFGSSFWSVVKRSLFSQRFWTKEEEVERFDIFHSPFFYAPRLKRAKLVLTVHDLRLNRFPNTYGRFRYMFLQRAVKKSILRADRIISISQFTKDEIIETCKVKDDKITVIHEAVDRKSFSPQLIASYQLPQEYSYLKEGRFLFSLGHIEPRKNYLRLIESFKKLKADSRYNNLKLVIAGKPYVDAENIIHKIETTEDVVYMNFVPRDLLLWLYRNASLFVFPSYYEGFGFPPLEAASMGTVSAVSQVSSMPEVCGNSAFYFNPYDVDSMTETIARALDGGTEFEKKKAGLDAHLSTMSWQRNAEDTIKLYNSVKL